MNRNPVRAKATSVEPKPIPLEVLCVQYAQLIAGYSAGFEASGDNDYASDFGTPLHRRAIKLLEKITTTPAKTASEVEAKARIFALVMDDDGGSATPHNMNFLSSFGADVCAYMRIVREIEFKANREQMK